MLTFLKIILLFSSSLVKSGGIMLILLLIFAETGLLLGLFVPGGETLLFTAGLLTSTKTLHIPIYVLLFLLIMAGILGDLSGYFIGKKFGGKLFQKEDTWYFKKKYLEMTKSYYDRNQKTALVFGKFLPVIRPFNPVIAGITGVPFVKFIILSIIATSFYTATFCLLGYLLGNQFPEIQKYLGWIVPASIIISVLSVVREVRKQNKKSN